MTFRDDVEIVFVLLRIGQDSFHCAPFDVCTPKRSLGTRLTPIRQPGVATTFQNLLSEKNCSVLESKRVSSFQHLGQGKLVLLRVMFGSDSCQTFFCFFFKQHSRTVKDFFEERHETIG